MSTELDAGRHLIVGVSGTSLNEIDRKILKSVKPIGILFLKRNLDHSLPYQEWHKKFADLLSEIKEITGREKMLFTIDHEGGQVQRTPAPITNFGTPEKYAKKSGEIARAQAKELKSLGINLSWAPLGDINTNPQNPIIGKLGRSFGATAGEVTRAAVPYLKSLLAEGIFGCAKHFPGHGDTWSDSHLELPIVKLLESKARERELQPFKALIAAGVQFIMTAHVMFPEIDRKFPATLSEHIITDILRNDLGFKKVIIADDVNMKAIAERFENESGLTQAFNAGVDMFIVGRYPNPDSDETPMRLADHMQSAIESGAIKKNIIEKSRARIDTVMKELHMHTPSILDSAILERHKNLATSIA